MSLTLATRRPVPVKPDTFLMPTRQYFFPQLATATSGTWGWTGSTSSLFGGTYNNTSAASGDYVEWANVSCFGANAKVKILFQKASNGGIVKVYWNGDLLGSVDTYNASATYNNTTTIDLGTVTAGRGTLRLISDTKNGSSSAYAMLVQQVELIQATGTGLGTSLDDLPWHGHQPAFSIYSAEYNNSGWIDYKSTIVPTQTASAQWGSYIQIAHGTYAWRVKYRFWAPQGTHTLNLRHLTSTSGGTITATVNGGATTPSTFSTSAGATNYNVSTNLTFTAATTGIQEIEFSGSGGVTCSLQWISWRKTSAIGAITATGTTYGVESAELWPWFANSLTNWVFSLSSVYLHYGVLFTATSGAQLAHKISPLSGSYAITEIARRDGGSAVVDLSLDGVFVDSADHFGATVPSFRFEMTGNLSPGVLVTTQNTAPYRNYQTMIRLLRTGD